MKKTEENKEPKFLGTILLLNPLIFPILEKIREKYDIDEVSPTENGLRERLLKDIDQEQESDWKAVRHELENEIRAIPDLLPPEFAFYHKIFEAGKTLPPEPTFTEPATEKLKADVTILYHGFYNLYNFVSTYMVSPWQTAIDKCFTDITDNAFEFLFSGKIRDIPHDWISMVNTLPMMGDDIVVAMASRLANPDEITEQFHQKLIDTFGKRRPKLTDNNLPYTEYLAMKLRRMRLRDIADEYILRHRRRFPKDPLSPEYKTKKRQLEINLKQIIKRLTKTLDNIIGDKIPPKSDP